MKELIEKLRNPTDGLRYNDGNGLLKEAADEIERLTAERDEVREALRIMLLQSPYQDGDGGHRYQACRMAQDALDHVPNVGKMVGQGAQGCTHCSHPLYAGTKCKNCGRVTDNDDTALLRMALEALKQIDYDSTEDGTLNQVITALRERLGEKVWMNSK